MTTPPLTREGIRPFLTDEIDEILQTNRYSDQDIVQFFSDEGELRCGNDCTYLIHMMWHRDQSNKVTGIFIRAILDDGSLLCWINPNVDNRRHFIWIRDNRTIIEGKPITKGLQGDVNTMLRTSKSPKIHVTQPQISIPNLQNREDIAAFFDRDREVLPEALRERIFLPAPQDPLPPLRNNHTYLYMGAALLLLIGIGILAKKHFSSSDWKRGK